MNRLAGYFPGVPAVLEDGELFEPLPGRAAEYPESRLLGSGEAPEVPFGPGRDAVLPLPMLEFVEVASLPLRFVLEFVPLAGALPG